jgi:Tol biopolymer transport system component
MCACLVGLALVAGQVLRSGRLVAYVSNRDEHGDIYVMDIATTRGFNITRSAFDDCCPAWSPDGNQIAFVSVRDGDAEIYTLDITGSDLRQITDTPLHERSPAWSPDGQHIAFLALHEQSVECELYIMGADGSHVDSIADCVSLNWTDGPPSWSPDGRQIAFAAIQPTFGMGIFAVDVEGENSRWLTPDIQGGHIVTSPTWSPDGQHIAFVSDHEGSFQVYVTNADGSGIRRLTPFAASSLAPAWSPDGQHLAFAVWISSFTTELFIMDVMGNSSRQITNSRESLEYAPAWQP